MDWGRCICRRGWAGSFRVRRGSWVGSGFFRLSRSARIGAHLVVGHFGVGRSKMGDGVAGPGYPRGEDNAVLRRHHLDPGTIDKALKAAAKRAGLVKRVTSHVLRHSFATYLLLRGTDIREIQELQGHRDLSSTMIYTHVVREIRGGVVSPLDSLREGIWELELTEEIAKGTEKRWIFTIFFAAIGGSFIFVRHEVHDGLWPRRECSERLQDHG
ncbi:MAG: hypothetical protein CMO80_10980 [Verrucomicrobiales bacterium]|nr:hypothetical protein [Verrucomicrobiales bacterium]